MGNSHFWSGGEGLKPDIKRAEFYPARRGLA